MQIMDPELTLKPQINERSSLLIPQRRTVNDLFAWKDKLNKKNLDLKQQKEFLKEQEEKAIMNKNVLRPSQSSNIEHRSTQGGKKS